jgi:hypothetical protein
VLLTPFHDLGVHFCLIATEKGDPDAQIGLLVFSHGFVELDDQLAERVGQGPRENDNRGFVARFADVAEGLTALGSGGNKRRIGTTPLPRLRAGIAWLVRKRITTKAQRAQRRKSNDKKKTSIH